MARSPSQAFSASGGGPADARSLPALADVRLSFQVEERPMAVDIGELLPRQDHVAAFDAEAATQHREAQAEVEKAEVLQSALAGAQEQPRQRAPTLPSIFSGSAAAFLGVARGSAAPARTQRWSGGPPTSDSESEAEEGDPSPGGSVGATSSVCTRLSGAEARRRSRLAPSQSAPMLGSPSAARTSASWSSLTGASWYSWDSRRDVPPSETPSWKPLGSTWRERSMGETGPVRENVDDGSDFVHGCVPQWGKGGCKRRRDQLEHELTWLYYSMRRHTDHPLRVEVGETLSTDAVPGSMRVSKKSAFRFWRDLRPPFRVVSTSRVGEASREKHADGDLFEVRYKCNIDYRSERAYGVTSAGSTFDNVCQGVATVRLPDGYPKRRMIIVSWGRPTLGAPKADTAKEEAVPPGPWMPICDELGLRADHPRLKGARAAAERLCAKRRSVEVAPLQRLMLGPHVSLPRLPMQQEEQQAVDAPPGSVSPLRRRQHRIFTASAGFVRYGG